MSNFNIDWVKDNFPQDLVIFYIGATDLNEVINFRNHLPDSNLFAFECSNYWVEKFPIKEKAEQFNIGYYHVALSDKIGKINFYPCLSYKDEDWPVSSSIYEPTTRLNYLNFSDLIEVESMTIEHFCLQQNISPDFIHIDAQGAEFAVFSKIGKNLPKAIWTEISEFDNYKTGTTYLQFRKLMNNLGYVLFFKDDADELFVLKSLSFKPYIPKEQISKKLKFVFNYSSSKMHGENRTVFYNLCKALDISESYKVDNLPKEIFIYEYQHNWEIKTSDFFGNNGFLEMDPCPENVLDRIKEKTAYLLISIPFESPLEEIFLKFIHSYFAKKDLPASQIIYQTCCLNGQELYENYCKSIGDSSKLNFEYMAENFLMHYGFALKIKQNENHFKTLNKDFLMFNRRWLSHPHRTLFLYNIFKRNLIDNFYISFTKLDVDHKINYSTAVKDHCSNFYNKKIDFNTLEIIENKLPLILDTEDLVSSNLMFEQFSDTKHFYDTSLIHIVSETYFYSNIIHLTEKTFKPILYKQPFIMLGPPFMLKKLRELGFKTFNDIWDESYDEITNHNERFEKILNLVEQIAKMNKTEKNELLEKCQKIIYHNFEIVANFKSNKLTVSNFINKYKLI
jgi:FkbM family methyltransferase